METSGAVDNYSREGFKICEKFPTYAGVSDRASMIIQRGHDEKTPLSNHLLLQAFGLDNLVCRCSRAVSITTVVVCKYVLPGD